MSMSRGIAALPLELLINVISNINLEDFVNLKTARMELFRLMDHESLSRGIVKVFLSFFFLFFFFLFFFKQNLSLVAPPSLSVPFFFFFFFFFLIVGNFSPNSSRHAYFNPDADKLYTALTCLALIPLLLPT